MNHHDILKATQDFLGNLQDDHSQPQQVTGTLKRELDSLDDFEHLGHDSSPITETKATVAAAVSSAVDNVTRISPHARDPESLIDTGDDGVHAVQFGSRAAVGKLAADDVLHFDPLTSTTQYRLDTALYEEVAPQRKTMDSNLLQMGGDTFPDRKDADDKLDKFLSELSTISSSNTQPIIKDQTPEHATKDIFEDFKADAMKFTEEVMVKPIEKAVDDLLERFSDSDDDCKPTKVSHNAPEQSLPNVYSAADQIKSDNDQTFKDFDEYVDYSHHKTQEIAPAKPSKDDSFEKFESELKSEPILIHPEPIMKPIPTVPVPEPEVEEIVPVVEEPPKSIKVETKAVIEAEAMFCKMGLDAWFNPERLDPQVESLIYWRDPKKSGPVFGGVLVVLLALTYFSLISVVAYLSLLGLTATISFRIYKNIVQAVQKTGDGHPFKEYLEWNLALPQQKVDELCKVAVAHLNAGVTELRRLFLVEDLVDSIKFGVFLWCMTYLGAWFNGMTLIILAWVALFSLPKVYETNKIQIDANLDIVRSKLAEITSKVKAAVPIGKKSEEKKE